MKSLLRFLILSLILHFLIGWILTTSGSRLNFPDHTAINVELRPAVQPSTDARQIVQQNEKSVNEEAPKNSKFLSEKNQSVKKQTVAPLRGNFKNSNVKSWNKMNPEERHKIYQDLFKPMELCKSAGKVPTEGPSQTDDHLPDIDQGAETLLNAHEFKYYSYFNRIRQQLSSYWRERIREKIIKLYTKNGTPITQGKDHVTKVIVFLTATGELQKIQVIGDSGVQDLDDAAVESFREAAPFPNPPQELVEADGAIKIRWDFILEN